MCTPSSLVLETGAWYKLTRPILYSGTGSSAIYPLLGTRINPNLNFIASECDDVSYDSALKNILQNNLENRITLVKVDSNEAILPPGLLDSADM